MTKEQEEAQQKIRDWEKDIKNVSDNMSGKHEFGQVMVTTIGLKFDQNKPDMTDIPKEAMWTMGAAFSHGQKKYGKNNYRKGMAASRQLAAAVRHIYQHLDGETLDPESGVMHLGHALASIAMACYTISNHPELDDRYKEDVNKHEKE